MVCGIATRCSNQQCVAITQTVFTLVLSTKIVNVPLKLKKTTMSVHKIKFLGKRYRSSWLSGSWSSGVGRAAVSRAAVGRPIRLASWSSGKEFVPGACQV